MSGRFSAQEWSVIAGTPLPAGIFVIAGGSRRHALDARCRSRLRGACDTELTRELLATPPAVAIQRPRDREALRAEAPAALRHAMEILETRRDGRSGVSRPLSPFGA
jgi:hypothetical protein